MINLMSKLDRRLLAIEIKVYKLEISILAIYLLLLTHDLKLLWFCFFFFHRFGYLRCDWYSFGSSSSYCVVRLGTLLPA